MAREKDDRQAETGPRLAVLLARLAPDSNQAGQEYERLRRTLIKFFDWRGGWPPDECADDCLDRLARRLTEQVPVQDVRQFALGIARLVLLERRRRPAMSSIEQLPEAAIASRPTAVDEESAAHACLDRCLAALPAGSRSLVIGYYEGERAGKITNRQRLSTALGVSEGALRSRVQRVRNHLESCVRSCLDASKGVPS